MKNPLRTIQVLFDDEHLLAVTKPAGVASVHDGAHPKDPDLHAVLEDHEGELFPIHRLDKETSGVIVFARTEEAHRAMSMMFETREVQKTYHAIVEGLALVGSAHGRRCAAARWRPPASHTGGCK